jgi:hypothetical protein
MAAISWLLLLYSLPTDRNSERVVIWRRPGAGLRV